MLKIINYTLFYKLIFNFKREKLYEPLKAFITLPF